MTIKVTYNVTDVYVTQDVSPVYINVSYSGGGSGGAAVWGGITGTLSDQTDLQTALDGKFDDPTGTTSQYLRGDGSLATFPSLTGYVPYTGATGDVNLGTHRILAQNATISSSGSGDTATINHSSGSGIGLNITKGGNGEGLYINKTGGSGNAATIIGTLNATTLVKSGGTSSQFLKADGSVDSSVYVPTSTTLTINGVTFDLSANRTFTVGSVTGSGASGQVAYWTGTSSQSGSNNLFWDATNGRLGIGTNVPTNPLQILLPQIDNEDKGILISKGIGFILLANGTSNATNFIPKIQGKATNDSTGLLISGQLFNTSSVSASIRLQAQIGNSVIQSSQVALSVANYATILAQIMGNGNLILQNGGTFTDSGQRLQVQGTTLLNGNVTFSSATGMTWDATNGRLGIGTNAPSKLLSINGEAEATVLRGSTIYFRAGAGTDFYIKYDSGDFMTYRSFSLHRWQTFGTTYDTRMQLFSTGNLLLQNGGTFTDSGERLQVTGTMKVTGNVSVDTNTLFVDTTNKRIGVRTATPGAGIDVWNVSTTEVAQYRLSDSRVTIPNYSSTGFNPSLTANTCGFYAPFSSSTGGLQFVGFTSNINTGTPFAFVGIHGGTAPTTAALRFIGFKHDGSTNRTPLTGTEIIAGFSAGFNADVFQVKANGRINMSSLPTSPTGLSSGDLWNNLGMVNIV
jgi:hypothetical protein